MKSHELTIWHNQTDGNIHIVWNNHWHYAGNKFPGTAESLTTAYESLERPCSEKCVPINQEHK